MVSYVLDSQSPLTPQVLPVQEGWVVKDERWWV
jgi:hypothetical protein